MSKILQNSGLFFTMSILCLLVFSGIVYSQSNQGTIIGTVKDPNDAVVPNAKVTIINNANGETHEVVSNDSGEFAVTNLEPGKYQITVEARDRKSTRLNSSHRCISY